VPVVAAGSKLALSSLTNIENRFRSLRGVPRQESFYCSGYWRAADISISAKNSSVAFKSRLP
jgi:hypothetical protein